MGTLLQTFIRLHAILGALAFLVIAAIVLVAGVPFALSFLIVVGLLEFLIFGVYIAWVVHAVNTYGGVPFPGIFGLMGVEVVDAKRPERPVNGWAGNARRVCLRCGGVTEGEDSEYCRTCGAPFASDGTPA